MIRSAAFASLLAFVGFVPGAAAQAGPVSPGNVPAGVLRTGLRFVENAGQWDPKVRFRARSGDLELWFTDDGWVARFGTIEREAPVPAPLTPPARSGDRFVGSTFAFRPKGAPAQAAAAPRLEPGAPLTGNLNYLIGNDPSAWRRGVRSYDSIVYRDWLPGVDVRFGERNGVPTYDILVAPGAAADSLEWECSGADAIAVDADGSLVMRTAAGELRHRMPVSYEITESGLVRPLASRFVLRGEGKVGFEVAGRHPARPLVIDPGIVYASYLGGSTIDAALAVCSDVGGNAYVTGYTISTNFPVTNGAFDTTQNFSYDAFVAKVKADGTAIEYATYLGGHSTDQGLGIATDAAGAAYVTGTTLSIDFPTNPSAYDRIFGFGFIFGDGFVTKLTPTGDNFSFSTYLGGNGDDSPLRITVDGALDVHVAGWTRSTDFITPATAGTAFDNSYNGTSGSDLGDAFYTKLKADGTTLLYATLLGGPSSDGASSVAIDSTGKVVIAGLAKGGFPTKASPFAAFGGGADVFVARIDPTLAGANSLLTSAIIGGGGDDFANAMALDASDAIYLTGNTSSTGFKTVAGSFDVKYNGGTSDGFVMKLDAAVTQVGYSGFLGGNSSDVGTSIAVDAAGAAYVGGRTTSSNFPSTPGALKTKKSGGIDGFVTKISPSGALILTSGYVGGSANDDLPGLALAGPNLVWIAGTTVSTNFPVTADGLDKTLNSTEAYVAKIDLGPAPILGLDTSNPIQVIHDTLGGGPPADVHRNVSNVGSPESVLGWHVAEVVDATWLSETPGLGSATQGGPPIDCAIAFDPTGLAIGPYTTTLRYSNDDDANDTIDVPVLMAVQDLVVAPFLPGNVLDGTVAFQGEIDLGSFTAIKGMTLKLKFVSLAGGDLAPILSILDAVDTTIWTKTLKHNEKGIAKSYKFTADGNYRLKVEGTGATTGGYSTTTAIVLPADAKPFKKKNQHPKVDGAPVDFKIRMLAGATLAATVEPVTTLGGALAITLLDPTQTPIDLTAFTTPFGVGGLQINAVPIATAGQYTLRITGPATIKEKVNVTSTPTQPLGVGNVNLP